MKTIIKTSLVLAGLCLTGYVNAQEVTFGHTQNMIPRSKDGINVFDVKKDSAEYKGISVYLGGAFAMQFQALNSFNDQKTGTYAANPPIKAVENYRLNDLEKAIQFTCCQHDFWSSIG